MPRRVFITGLGPVSGFGFGHAPNWQRLLAGESAFGPVSLFDASAMANPFAAQAPDYKLRDHVPKSYRKATKVMSRDIELAVIAAHLAVEDAGLHTPGLPTPPENASTPTYASERLGCHIGAGLIAADINELTTALDGSRQAEHPTQLDLEHWGREGMQSLTPLWLLKYLPNMLACHVTILHDARGPSNTITCAATSGSLSLGESLRVIQRGHADACLCGGVESKLNPLGYLRQISTGRYAKATPQTDPATLVRPFDEDATGGAIGEGGGILVLEAEDTFSSRTTSDSSSAGSSPTAYAEVVGFAATQSVHRSSKNRKPDPTGTGLINAAHAALREAGLGPDDVDLIIPFGLGDPEYDTADAAALRSLFGDRLAGIPVLTPKAQVGNTVAGAAAIDLALAALILHHQQLPPILNRDNPLPCFAAPSTVPDTGLNTALLLTTGLGGQNTAVVLKRVST
ncbi:MAG: beta-ketoacyl synthase N-terminal-like domain-containing protein [Planctomycetota bacterium]